VTENFNEQIRFVEKDIIYVLRLTLAFILIIIGFIGLLFPLIPDWQLLFVGIIILDVKGVMRHRIVEWFPDKYKKKIHKLLLLDKKKKEGEKISGK